MFADEAPRLSGLLFFSSRLRVARCVVFVVFPLQARATRSIRDRQIMPVRRELRDRAPRGPELDRNHPRFAQNLASHVPHPRHSRVEIVDADADVVNARPEARATLEFTPGSYATREMSIRPSLRWRE